MSLRCDGNSLSNVAAWSWVRKRMRRVGSLRSRTAGARSNHSQSRTQRRRIARTSPRCRLTVALFTRSSHGKSGVAPFRSHVTVRYGEAQVCCAAWLVRSSSNHRNYSGGVRLPLIVGSNMAIVTVRHVGRPNDWRTRLAGGGFLLGLISGTVWLIVAYCRFRKSLSTRHRARIDPFRSRE